MSQHDYDVSNQAGAAFRADLNLALAAIRNLNSGATEPASMVAYMWWMDTTTGTLKQRNAANTAWVVGGITSFASIATAAGTTTLVFDSAEDIEFTGGTTQTVVMPVTTTLPVGWKRNIINNSTGALTINSSGGNLIQTVLGGSRTTLTCVLASGTTAASWAITGTAGEEYTAASAACTGAITTAAIWKLTKIGNLVTLTLPAVTGAGVATTSFAFGTAIPARFRPSQDTEWLCVIKDNGVPLPAPGAIFIFGATGVINVFKELTVTTNFTAAATAGLPSATSVSWTI